MIKSAAIHSPQNYLELVTGKCYIVNGDNDVEFIEKILEQSDECLWSYDFTEVEHIIENDLNVVLVDCMVYNEDKEEFEHTYRWFEIPESVVHQMNVL